MPHAQSGVDRNCRPPLHPRAPHSSAPGLRYYGLAMSPTLTALGVAALRAVRSPEEQRLLPLPLRAVVRAAQTQPRASQAILRRVTSGLSSNVPARTELIDAAVGRAIGKGASQVVLLGSGLDMRAWRMRELREAIVFEVDRPANHRYKSARLPPAPCGMHRYVAVDFERDSVAERLGAAGHDAGKPSLWICEGVLVYLTPETRVGLLDVVARLSAAGSRLILTYTPPGFGQSRKPTMHVRLIARLIGERVTGEVEAGRLEAELNERGFEVISDESLRDSSSGPDWERVVEAHKVR